MKLAGRGVLCARSGNLPATCRVGGREIEEIGNSPMLRGPSRRGTRAAYEHTLTRTRLHAHVLHLRTPWKYTLVVYRIHYVISRDEQAEVSIVRRCFSDVGEMRIDETRLSFKHCPAKRETTPAKRSLMRTSCCVSLGVLGVNLPFPATIEGRRKLRGRAARVAHQVNRYFHVGEKYVTNPTLTSSGFRSRSLVQRYISYIARRVAPPSRSPLSNPIPHSSAQPPKLMSHAR